MTPSIPYLKSIGWWLIDRTENVDWTLTSAWHVRGAIYKTDYIISHDWRNRGGVTVITSIGALSEQILFVSGLEAAFSHRCQRVQTLYTVRAVFDELLTVLMSNLWII